MAVLAENNADQCFAYANTLVKEIEMHLGTDLSDSLTMYILHGRTLALSEIIKIIPKLKYGIPNELPNTAFVSAVELVNSDMNTESGNVEVSCMLAVCNVYLCHSSFFFVFAIVFFFGVCFLCVFICALLLFM